jgi:catechol 2,3-dioxygenase-like lactoylglutathione lyase family enzyme
MLGDEPVCPTIAVKDVEETGKFYKDVLGLKEVKKDKYMALYQAGDGSMLMLYPSGYAGSNKATYAGWEVKDLDAVMKGLRDKGVEFEEYDFDELKTVNGVAEEDGYKSAWFKDPEGNILAINQTMKG